MTTYNASLLNVLNTLKVLDKKIFKDFEFYIYVKSLTQQQTAYFQNFSSETIDCIFIKFHRNVP